MTSFSGNFVLAAGDRAFEAPLSAYASALAEMASSLAAAGVLSARDAAALAAHHRKDEFLLHPDHSAPLRALHAEKILGRPQGCGDLSASARSLSADLSAFLAGAPCPAADAGETIPGTSVRLTPVRNNPYDGFDAHPDHAGVSPGWGTVPQGEWFAVFGKAWALMRAAHPAAAAETALLVRKAVPLGASASAHNSGSYREAVGSLYLGYLTGVDLPEVAVLEALVHEAAHNKLNLLSFFGPLLTDDLREIYYSPWRPDPRHMTGVFLGLHAFAGVVRVLLAAYEKGVLAHEGWLDKVLAYHLKNELAYRVVARHARLTATGAAILSQVAGAMADARRAAASLRLPAERLAAAGRAAREHFRDAAARRPDLAA